MHLKTTFQRYYVQMLTYEGNMWWIIFCSLPGTVYVVQVSVKTANYIKYVSEPVTTKATIGKIGATISTSV